VHALAGGGAEVEGEGGERLEEIPC